MNKLDKDYIGKYCTMKDKKILTADTVAASSSHCVALYTLVMNVMKQYQLIKDMSAAFFLPVDIVGCETVRDADGLALSSRNQLLDACARRKAGCFNVILRNAVDDETAIRELQNLGAQVDYVETTGGRRFGAIVLPTHSGEVRLIDNLVPVHA